MKRSRIIVLAAGFVMAALLVFFGRESLPVHYHLWRLKSAAAEHGRAYRHQETWWDKWAVRSCQVLHIKRESPGIRKSEEMRLLLDMGYLRKVEFPLTNRINFGVLVTNALREFPGEWWELGSNPSQTVAIVTAPTNQLVQWRELVYTRGSSK